MDEILAIIMQDKAYREQAKFKTYPTPTINPINQLIQLSRSRQNCGSSTKGSIQHHGNSLPIRSQTTLGHNRHRNHTDSPVSSTPLGHHRDHSDRSPGSQKTAESNITSIYNEHNPRQLARTNSKPPTHG